MLDGLGSTEDYVLATKKQGLNAIAITDHGVTYGLIDFYKTCKKHGIKPILGQEFYWHEVERGCRDLKSEERGRHHHLVVLAKNNTGYRNLLNLTTIAHTDGFYYDPQIDDEVLYRYREGLIILSGCIGGYIPKLLREGKYGEARAHALKYKEWFGDDFYLEIQDHSGGNPNPNIVDLLDSGYDWEGKLLAQATTKEEQRLIKAAGEAGYIANYYGNALKHVKASYRELLNIEKIVLEGTVKLANELGIKLVATNDCHYINREDAIMQDYMLAMGQNKWVLDYNRLFFSTDTFYLRSPEEMNEIFSEYPQALESTAEIVAKCNVEIPELEQTKKGIYLLPSFPDVPDGMTEEEYLRSLCQEGWKKYVQPRIDAEVIPEQEYKDRLEYELSTISSMGWPGYFLIVQDILRWCRKNGIPVGPGRGSSAGSLVSYLIEITEIDPLYMPAGEFLGKQEPMGLLFERFLNPSRISMPDIDIDISRRYRNDVVEYVTNKYGAERVSSILTINTFGCKSALKKAGSALMVDFKKMNDLTASIPDGVAIEEANIDIIDSEIEMVVDIAKKIEGMPQYTGVHAAGVVISDKPLWNYVATKVSDDVVVAQDTMEHIEELGLLKMDLLGLRNLDVIGDTVNAIEQKTNSKFNIRDIPLNDPDAYNLYCSGDVFGIFQVESNLNKTYLRKNMPSTFAHIIEQLAIVRPGPLDAPAENGDGNMADEFFRRKHGQAKVTYLHESLEPILKDTHGIIVYQEQIMEISKVLAGFTAGEADSLRKVIGKKQLAKIPAMKEKFLNGCDNNGIPRASAEQIWSAMETFGNYGFNKSHAAAYALVSYRTAYLSAKYPVEFMASLLTSVMNDQDELGKYLKHCRQRGVRVLPPDINKSTDLFVADGDVVRFALCGVKHVGDSAVSDILRIRREVGEVKTIVDFLLAIDSTKVNKTVIESLAKVGAFDSLGCSRATILSKLDEFLAVTKKYKDKKKRAEKKEESLAFLAVSDVGAFQDSLFENVSEVDIVKDEYEQAVQEIFAVQSAHELTIKEIMLHEKELLGLYLSASPLDWAEPVLSRATHYSKDIEMCPRGTKVSCGGLVINTNRYKLRNGNYMGFADIEDEQGTFSIIVPEELYPSMPHKDDVIFVRGSVQISPKYGHNVRVSKINIVDDSVLGAVQKPVEKETVLEVDNNRGILVMTNSPLVPSVVSKYTYFEGADPNDYDSYRLLLQYVGASESIEMFGFVSIEQVPVLWKMPETVNVVPMENIGFLGEQRSVCS